MFVTGSDDALTCLGPLKAKNLLQTLPLFLITRFLKLLLSDRLSRRLILKNLHQLHVKLVALLHNDLVGLFLVHIWSIRPVLLTLVQLAFAFRLLRPGHRHRLWNRLLLGFTKRHETAVMVSVRPGADTILRCWFLAVNRVNFSQLCLGLARTHRLCLLAFFLAREP